MGKCEMTEGFRLECRPAMNLPKNYIIVDGMVFVGAKPKQKKKRQPATDGTPMN